MINFNKLKHSGELAYLGVFLGACLISNIHAAQNYEVETIVTLQSIIDDLNDAGYYGLADSFEESGFHPDGIKAGKACTPTAGKLFVSSIATGSVLEIAENGKVLPYVNAKDAEAYGTTLDSQGNLFVSYIKRFTNVGGIDVVLAGTPTPADGKACYSIPDSSTTVNDLIVTKNGKTLYFSDDTGGRIFKCDVAKAVKNVSCNCKVWLTSANTASLLNVFGGVDGMILDSQEKNLYFNNFLSGKIYKVGINANGGPGKEQVVTSNPIYGFTDGMSLSTKGTSVYTATFKTIGSRISETNLATGITQVVIDDPQEAIMDPAAALTAVKGQSGYETLYLSSLDIFGMLTGYRNVGSNGGKIVKATLTNKPVVPDSSQCR